MIEASDVKDKKAIAASGNEDIHAEALRRFNDIITREQENRLLGVEDTRFAQTSNGMWDSIDEENSPDIPKYTFNLVVSGIDTIIGDQRLNEIAIKVRPNGGGASKRDAEIYNGLIKNIQSLSNFRAINDSSFDETLNSGYGGYRVVTRYTNDDVNLNSFDQEILIEPINSAVTSLFFGPSQRYDKSDALFAFLTWNEALDDFNAVYPDATVSDFTDPLYATQPYTRWFEGNQIRMAEYWRKIPVKRKIALLSDNRVIDLDDEKKVLDELEKQGLYVLRTRDIEDWQVERYVMNGAEILKSKKVWAGRLIPLIPQFGKITNVDGKQYVRSLHRFAKDANRVYNYLRSTIVSVVAKAPKDIFWMTPAQAAGHTNKLERMNIDDDPIQFYNPDPMAPGAPQRTGAPQVQAALIEAAQTAKLDVQAAMGVTPGMANPLAGTDQDDRSGKAILEQNRRGDSGAYVFMTNQALSIQALGNVLVDLIPRIYDSTRQIRILDEDGEPQELTINQTVKDEQSLENVIVNDLSKGRYSVVVDIGPAFATQRMEAADRLITLASDPESPYAKLTPDLIAKYLDLPGNASEELHKRLRNFMIKEGIVEPTPEEAAEMQPTEAELAAEDRKVRREEAETKLLEGQAMQLVAAAEKAVVDMENKDFDSNKKAVEALNDMLESLKKKREAGIEITIQDIDLLAGQMDMVELSVQNLQPGPNSNQQNILADFSFNPATTELRSNGF